MKEYIKTFLNNNKLNHFKIKNNLNELETKLQNYIR